MGEARQLVSGRNVPGPEVSLRTRVPDVVDMAVEELGDRPAVVFRVHPSRHQGALAGVDWQTIAAAARTALGQRLPLVGVLSSSGADVFDGVDALHGWGSAARAMVACSGVVPIVLAITGPALSGPSLLLGLADQVVMTEDAFAFVSGPKQVATLTGEQVDAASLGGVSVHARATGVASLVAPDEEGRSPGLVDLLPTSPAGVYDMRHLIEEVVDDGVLLELRATWAPNLVTALATVAGRPVGVVANQPQTLAGTLDIAASQKGARFVAFCDAFNLPLLTFVDTSGYFPGQDLEWRGIIRHGAQLAFAYAEATVPRVCVIVRKAIGGAYIVMDSRSMGNDICFAWPSAQVAVMGAQGAVSILHRGADDETLARLVEEYEATHLTPWMAAERGYVDDVINPADTRPLVARALDVLANKRERLVRRRHANGPL
jgi:acetyl-CoA carboxylase carboxyltransferase component